MSLAIGYVLILLSSVCVGSAAGFKLHKVLEPDRNWLGELFNEKLSVGFVFVAVGGVLGSMVGFVAIGL